MRPAVTLLLLTASMLLLQACRATDEIPLCKAVIISNCSVATNICEPVEDKKCNCSTVVDCSGMCGGSDLSCAGCDDVPLSGKVDDACSVCGGNNSTCLCEAWGSCTADKETTSENETTCSQKTNSTFEANSCNCSTGELCVFWKEGPLFHCNGSDKPCVCPGDKYDAKSGLCLGKSSPEPSSSEPPSSSSKSTGSSLAKSSVAASSVQSSSESDSTSSESSNESRSVSSSAASTVVVDGDDDSWNIYSLFGKSVVLYAVVPLLLVVAFGAFVCYQFRRMNRNPAAAAAAAGGARAPRTQRGYAQVARDEEADAGSVVMIPMSPGGAAPQPPPSSARPPSSILKPVSAQPPAAATRPAPAVSQGTTVVGWEGWDDDDDWAASAKPARNVGHSGPKE